MFKIKTGVALTFLFVLGSLLFFAPDILSLAFVGVMAVAVLLGFVFGILPAIRYTAALKHAAARIRKVNEAQPGAEWLSLQQEEALFGEKELDGLFDTFRLKAAAQIADQDVISDVEDIINEDSLALRSWWGVVREIPGTLTAVGLLGTFVGLIIGVSSLGFSSAEAVLTSIELLLAGVETAFYTSIAGVILSILFNLIQKTCWNMMLRELGLFCEVFHNVVFPTAEEQMRGRDSKYMVSVREQLKGLPLDRDYSVFSGAAAATGLDAASEHRMMPEIRKGLLNNEFVFLIQPRYDLASRKIVGGEALMRWDHSELGMIYPAAFMHIVERNGFVVRIDKFIWEKVCRKIRSWMDEGRREVPISVNISKIDILAMDVAEELDALVKKYDIPPRSLELEIAGEAYLECEEAALELEAQLRNRGFRVILEGCDDEYLNVRMLENTHADAVKLDLQYMGTMSEKRESTVETIMEKAHKLHIPVWAKRIENAEQLGDLRRCGCTEGQGNFLKKPVTPEEFEMIAE